jgi:hypothetical protein
MARGQGGQWLFKASRKTSEVDDGHRRSVLAVVISFCTREEVTRERPGNSYNNSERPTSPELILLEE